jgi:hypothetical protein
MNNYKISIPIKYVTLSVLLLIGLTATNCIREVRTPEWSFGRILILKVTPPEKLKTFSFIDNRPDIGTGKSYSIKPIGSDRILAATKVKVINEKSAKALLSIDKKSTFLQDSAGNHYPPMDPWDSASITEDISIQSKYVPFLQGEYSLARNQEVEGWIFFEVPIGVEVAILRWQEADDIVVNFAD